VSDRPRVLIVVEQLRRTVPGGIGAYTTGLLAGIAQCAESGDVVDVSLLASRPTRHAPSAARHGDDPLARFGHPLVVSRLPGPLLTRAWDRGWVRAPAGFDVVHSVSLAGPLRLPSGSGTAVITVHDVAWRRHPEATTRRGATWHEAALGRARNSGAALVVTSKVVAADLINDGIDADRISIVHGGSDHLAPEDPVGTEALLGRLGVRGEFLLTVSTLEPRKNIARLVEAYGRARAALPEPWPLVIVGPSGWGPALHTAQGQEGVVFTGAVSAEVLSGLYRRARAFAYVPLSEGYGLPPLEAMRMGTPSVVAHEVPSVMDLGDPGPPPAVIVDPTDIDEIAAGLVAVLTDDVVRADLAGRGEAHARARTWRTAAHQTIGLWRSLR
jgi:glycosyltransferase involved in cell wall biosynthesis